MRSLNRCEFIGYAGADAELRMTPAGSKVATFNVAVTRTWGAEGARQERTEWIRCSAWDGERSKLATITSDYVKKGAPLFVAGRLESREWEHASGVKMRSYELVIAELILLGKKSDAPAPAPSAATDADAHSLPF